MQRNVVDAAETALRLRTWRCSVGISKRAMARAIGVTPGAINSWERGDSEPTQENLRRFCRVVGIALHVFWGPLGLPHQESAAA